MSRLTHALLLAVLVVVVMIFHAVSATAVPEDYGLPSRLQSLTDLGGPMERKDITRVQKTEALLCWLKQEIDDPSPTKKGEGGGSITSGYIQAQIVHTIGAYGDTLAVDKAASDTKTDPRIRELLSISLGIEGDTRQVTKLTQILGAHKDPYIRALAARALGDIGATEAVPALERALQDEYSEEVFATMALGTETFYPVRQSAQENLRILRDPKGLEEAKQRTEAFAKRLAESQKTEPPTTEPPAEELSGK